MTLLIKVRIFSKIAGIQTIKPSIKLKVLSNTINLFLLIELIYNKRLMKILKKNN